MTEQIYLVREDGTELTFDSAPMRLRDWGDCCSFCSKRRQLIYCYKREPTSVCWDHWWMLRNMGLVDLCDLSQIPALRDGETVQLFSAINDETPDWGTITHAILPWGEVLDLRDEQ